MTTSIINKLSEQELFEASNFIGGYIDILNDDKYKSLKTISNQLGEKETKQICYIMLVNQLKDAIDISPATITDVVYMILENYPDISLNDITYFAKKVKHSQLPSSSKVFKYDVPFVCLLFQQYYNQRMYELEQLRTNSGDVIKKLSDDQLKNVIEISTEKNGLTINETGDERLTRLYKDSVSTSKPIYKNIEQYCKETGLRYEDFLNAYSEIYYNAEKSEQTISRQDYINVMCNRFIVFQNTINTKKDINKLYYINELIHLIDEYNISGIVEVIKSNGLWMIPTEHYENAKRLYVEGGQIKLKQSLISTSAKKITDFIKKIFEDKIGTSNLLFIITYIFNITAQKIEHGNISN